MQRKISGSISTRRASKVVRALQEELSPYHGYAAPSIVLPSDNARKTHHEPWKSSVKLGFIPDPARDATSDSGTDVSRQLRVEEGEAVHILDDPDNGWIYARTDRAEGWIPKWAVHEQTSRRESVRKSVGPLELTHEKANDNLPFRSSAHVHGSADLALNTSVQCPTEGLPIDRLFPSETVSAAVYHSGLSADSMLAGDRALAVADAVLGPTQRQNRPPPPPPRRQK